MKKFKKIAKNVGKADHEYPHGRILLGGPLPGENMSGREMVPF